MKKERKSRFLVEANVCVFANARVIVSAVDNLTASQMVEKLLDKADFKLTIENPGNPKILLHFSDENIETEVFEVRRLGASVSSD
jgi:hypothetical protein